MNSNKPVIGILGAGKLSVVLSQLAVKAGYEVYVSNSTDPKHLILSFSVLSPGTHVVSREQLIKVADVIILALPLSKYMTLPPDAFKGKLVIDAMNYWWEVDGALDTIHLLSISSTEHVQSYFKDTVVVKALNHIGYHDLYDHAAQPGDPDRRAVAIAGDDEKSISVVRTIVDDLGFDPLYIGALAHGRALEPGSNTFGASVRTNDLKKLLKPTL